ncbi:MAG TPA: hypothetical protein VJK02_14415 [Anaerolineales bacterium]|nr:hypothetical protein [Anaerolineales bacterium]
MASIALLWADIKLYVQSVGPNQGRPRRPVRCPQCEHDRIWYDGWRLIFSVVLIDGTPYRFDDGLWLQRVACSLCWFSWTCRPSFLYPHRSFEPDLVEAAALAYLADPAATYAMTSRRYGCSLTMLWGWIGWLSDLAAPGEIVAEAVRLDPSLPAAELIPHSVPQDHPKGYSPKRQNVLLRAFQVLVAMMTLARAQAVPLSDPSPLRWFLACQFLVFRRKALVSRPGWSPAIKVVQRGPT